MNRISHRRKKLLLRGVVILAVVALVVVLLNLIASRYVEHRIRNVISGETHRGYRIQYNSVHVNLLTFSLSFKDVTLMPEKNKTAEGSSSGSGNLKIEAHIPVLRIRFVPVISFLTGSKNLRIGEVLCNRARIRVTGARNHAKMPSSFSKKIASFNSFHLPLFNLESLTLNFLDFKNLSILWIDPKKQDTLMMGKELNIRAGNLYLQRSDRKSKYMNLKLDKLSLQMWNQKLFGQIGNYRLSFSSARFDAKRERLTLKDFHVFPIMNKYLLAKELRFRKGIFDVLAPSIVIDFAASKNQVQDRLMIDRIRIDKPNLNILVNTSLPIDVNKVKLMPNQLLNETHFGFSVDSLRFDNGKMVVEVCSDKPSVYFTFNKFHGTMSHITSVKSEMSKPLLMSFDGLLEHEIPVHYDLNFPYLIPGNTFYMKGILGSGHLSLFNPALISNAGMRFDSGMLESIVFEAQVRKTYVRGKMTMLYKNLSGAVLRKDRMKNNKLLTWVVNKVVKSDNPLPGDTVRIAPIFFDRKAYHGFGVMLFRPLINGIAATTVSAVARSNQKNIDRLPETRP